MTGIVHSTVATLLDEAGAEVNKAEWNADHAITGDVNFGGFSILNAVIAGSLITGLGTMSTQNANAVAITGGTATGLTSLSIMAGTLTTDVKPFSQTLTWNNAAVAFIAWDLIVTDTASAATALLLRIRGGSAGTTDFLALNKSGYVGIGTANPTVPLEVVRNSDDVLGFFRGTTYAIRFSSSSGWSGGVVEGVSTDGLGYRPLIINGSILAFRIAGVEKIRIDSAGSVGIGMTSPTAYLHIKAGTATANTAPLKLTSGTLNTTAEVGAIEFLTDAYYATITTGAARKTFAFLESPTFTGTVTIPTLVSTVKIRLKGYTVATLPAGTQGDTAFVTDAAAPAFLATIAGGGAVVTPVFYDGANWVGF